MWSFPGEIGRHRVMSGSEIGRARAKMWSLGEHVLVELGRVRANLDRDRANLVNSGPVFCRCWLMSGQTWSKARGIRANIDETGLNLFDSRKMLAELGLWPNSISSRIWSKLNLAYHRSKSP